MYRLKYILTIYLLIFVSTIFSIEITIDKQFSSADIYNGLTDSVKYSEKDIYISLQLNNSDNTEQLLYLSIINPTIDKIIIRDGDSTVILGDLIPFYKRNFKHYNHVYPFVLQAGSNKNIQIKIQKRWQSMNLRAAISTHNYFIRTTNHDKFYMGIFYGILFMYFMLLLCFYIFSKSNFFIIYILINFFMLLLIFQYSGTGFQYIWFYSTAVQKYITMLAAFGYLSSHIYFIRTFFAIQFKNSISGILLKILLYLFAAFAVLFIFQISNHSIGYNHTDIFYTLLISLFLFYGLMVMLLAIYSYKISKQREVIWVFFGMVFHLLNWIVFINNEFGILQPLNFLDKIKVIQSFIFVPQLNFFITILEIFVITVFISINYHKLIKLNNISTQRLDFLHKRNINTFVVGQEDEREKVSNEIAFAVTGDIKNLKEKLLKFAPKYDEKNVIPSVLNEINKTLEDIQNITNNYVAPDMQQMTLKSIITTATDKLYNEVNVRYDFTKISDNLILKAIANINIYRILQEISNNILKHAAAENVNIIVITDPKTLQIKITDDGIGFGDSILDNKGIGLMNIESRVNSLNGHFYVLSNVKNGSVLHLIFTLSDIL